MKHIYKNFEILKIFKHGYNYYKIVGEKDLYITLKAAKNEIDSRKEEDNERI